jgi:hypothetical protein
MYSPGTGWCYLFYFPLGWLLGVGAVWNASHFLSENKDIIIYTIGSLAHDILNMYLPLHDIGSNIS